MATAPTVDPKAAHIDRAMQIAVQTRDLTAFLALGGTVTQWHLIQDKAR